MVPGVVLCSPFSPCFTIWNFIDLWRLYLYEGLKFPKSHEYFAFPTPQALVEPGRITRHAGSHLAPWRYMSAFHYPETNGTRLSSYDKAQKIIKPKPFGSIYYKYKVSSMVHYVPPIQTQLGGITKNSEINMWGRACWNWILPIYNCLVCFYFHFPHSFHPTFPLPSIVSLCLSFFPKLIYMRE